MDINHGDRRRRWLLRRIIGYRFLFLIVLLSLNATGIEGDPCRAVSNLPACVSKVEIAENIVVRQFAKQEARTAGHYNGHFFLKLLFLHDETRLCWPYCGRSRKWIGGTLSKQGIFSFVQSPPHWADIDNDAVMWHSSWSKPVVLEMITEENVWEGNYCGIVRDAFGIVDCQPKAVKNRAYVGAELTPFSIAGDVSLSGGGMSSSPRFLNASYSGNQDDRSYNSVSDGRERGESRPPTYLAIMLSCFCLGGFVFAWAASFWLV